MEPNVSLSSRCRNGPSGASPIGAGRAGGWQTHHCIFCDGRHGSRRANCNTQMHRLTFGLALVRNHHRSLARKGRTLPLSNPRRLVVLTAFLAALLLVGFASYAALVDLRSGSTAAAESRAEEQSNQRDKVAALGRIEPYSEIINLGAGTSPDRLRISFRSAR